MRVCAFRLQAHQRICGCWDPWWGASQPLVCGVGLRG